MENLVYEGTPIIDVLKILQECTNDNEHSLWCYWVTFYFCPKEFQAEARKIVKYHERLGYLNHRTFLRRNRLLKKVFGYIRNAYGEELYAKIYATG